jgi:CheY-like chemotaxis protein
MRVIVCDDDPVIRYLLEVVIAKRGGHEVILVEDPAQVAALAATHRPDGVLLDYMMPGLSGLDVAGELSADPATAGIPVVFLTGRADVADQEFEALNVIGVIEKPFDTATLVSQLQSMIG